MHNSIYKVEEKTAKVKEQLRSITSSKRSLIVLFDYYQFLFEINNKQITEAYLPEFVQNYSDHLENFNPYCLYPLITEQIIEQAKKIAENFSGTEIADSLLISSEKLQWELDKFKKVLTGNIPEELAINKLCFPLLEENNDKTPEVSAGILETLTIKISKAKSENKFLLIPSEIKIELQLKNQLETSWQQAVEVVKRYAKKIALHHKVVIQFDKRVGFYRGNSLGAALTIAFIEELLDYYNSPVVIKTGKAIALTGGLEKDGSLIATSAEVIEKKVENVFYSPIQTFALPEGDLPYAEAKLKTLQKEFTERKLKLIGIKTFDDLLDSRKLVDIRKQKIIVRSAKFAKKNWLNTSISVIIALVISYLFILDFNNNPAILEHIGKNVLVKNKNGKVLWKKTTFDYQPNPDNVFMNNVFQKLVDINTDGINEVIITDLEYDSERRGALECYSANGELIWFYEFSDTIETLSELYTNKFIIRIAGVDTFENINILYLFAQHQTYFPTAVFRLNAETGDRLQGTYWNPGGIGSGVLHDINDDGIKELLLVGHNNEYESLAFFSMNKDILYGRGPALFKNEYIFPNKKIYDFINYLIIPNSDYNLYLNKTRYPLSPFGDLIYNKTGNFFKVGIYQGLTSDLAGTAYRFNSNLDLIKVVISDEFRIRRDSLVAQGKLSLPLTDTKEYVEILKDQVRYWDGEKFTRR